MTLSAKASKAPLGVDAAMALAVISDLGLAGRHSFPRSSAGTVSGAFRFERG